MKKTKFFENSLLDSSLITTVRYYQYDFKIINCNGYIQVYYYSNRKTKDNIKNLCVDELNKKENDILKQLNFDVNTSKNDNDKKSIRFDNIIRSKLSCQRLAKCNASDWQSFITLTYASNMQDIKQAKKDLYYFIINIQKVKSDFKYIAIPEFQKRGAIHFHLLTNLSKEDNKIIINQKDNIKYYDVKYWNKGFTSVEFLHGDIKKIIGYISKYMTKECDERLFAVKRYTCSQNLNKPIEEYIDKTNKKHYKYYLKLLKKRECIYTNSYIDKLGNEVVFCEYKSK